MDSRLKKAPLTGRYFLDIDEVIRKWNDNTYIMRNNENYTLKEYDIEGNEIFTVTVYTEQARKIIQKLNLVAYPSNCFNNCCS